MVVTLLTLKRSVSPAVIEVVQPVRVASWDFTPEAVMVGGAEAVILSPTTGG